MEWLPLILATGLLIQPAGEPLRLAGDAGGCGGGPAAALYVQANNEYLSCTAATCNELLFTSSFVAGCWARTVDDTAAERRFMGGGYNVTSGFLPQRLASTHAQCV